MSYPREPFLVLYVFNIYSPDRIMYFMEIVFSIHIINNEYFMKCNDVYALRLPKRVL